MNHHNKEIESMLLKDFDNDEIWAVYADWLQSKGDPRGTLIALEVKVAKLKGERTGGLDFEKNKEINIIQKNINDLYFNHEGDWVCAKQNDGGGLGNSIFYPYDISGYFNLRFNNGFVVNIEMNPHNENHIDIGELIFLETLAESIRVKLAESINRMPRLKNLSLRGCGLTEFPEFIKNHPSLEFIDLRNNPITKEIFYSTEFNSKVLEVHIDNYYWKTVDEGVGYSDIKFNYNTLLPLKD